MDIKRIKWEYRHHLNSRSSLLKTKEGFYYGRVKHTIKYKGNKQLACVGFNGNKRVSFVPFEELIFLKEGEK